MLAQIIPVSAEAGTASLTGITPVSDDVVLPAEMKPHFSLEVTETPEIEIGSENGDQPDGQQIFSVGWMVKPAPVSEENKPAFFARITQSTPESEKMLSAPVASATSGPPEISDAIPQSKNVENSDKVPISYGRDLPGQTDEPEVRSRFEPASEAAHNPGRKPAEALRVSNAYVGVVAPVGSLDVADPVRPSEASDVVPAAGGPVTQGQKALIDPPSPVLAAPQPDLDFRRNLAKSPASGNDPIQMGAKIPAPEASAPDESMMPVKAEKPHRTSAASLDVPEISQTPTAPSKLAQESGQGDPKVTPSLGAPLPLGAEKQNSRIVAPLAVMSTEGQKTALPKEAVPEEVALNPETLSKQPETAPLKHGAETGVIHPVKLGAQHQVSLTEGMVAPSPRDLPLRDDNINLVAGIPKGASPAVTPAKALTAPTVIVATGMDVRGDHTQEIQTEFDPELSIRHESQRLETTPRDLSPVSPPRTTSAPAIVAQIVTVTGKLADGPVDVSLAPEELGRVRLSLNTSEMGLVVQVMAERPETLDLLRRNIDLLERDLQDQGYGALSFSFGQGGSGAAGFDLRESEHGAADRRETETAFSETPALLNAEFRPVGASVLQDHLDMRL